MHHLFGPTLGDMIQSHLILKRVPMDLLEWKISQDTSYSIVASLANTVGAAKSILRIAPTGHDKRLFLKVLLHNWNSSFMSIMTHLDA
ncbi:hypothetical protein UlMin_024694 [Ulmus minor]